MHLNEMDMNDHMTELSEKDLALVNALQIAPRAPWKDLAPILDSTPTALAARWNRLRESGSAWITAYPSMRLRETLMSYVELDCEPGTKPEILARLSRDPRVITIEESARGRDLLLTVIGTQLQDVTEFALDDLPALPGVLRPRTHFVTKLHTEGAQWRLDALDAAQRNECESLAHTGSDGRGGSVPDSGPLIDRLVRDGRETAADIARATGRNPATTRRQIARLLGSGQVSVRCEIAQGRSRWPVTCTYLTRVPPYDLDRTVKALKTLPELRVCVSTTGTTNMLFSLWAGSIRDLYVIEQRFGKHLPWLDVVDSAVTLRNPKRMSWLLNADGTTTGEVITSGG
jgi:DNA-binding Lrp family transcriptional regulator